MVCAGHSGMRSGAKVNGLYFLFEAPLKKSHSVRTGGYASGGIDTAERTRNRNRSRIRARVEHVFTVAKRLLGFASMCYRGLDKNANRSFMALGLANCTWRAPI